MSRRKKDPEPARSTSWESYRPQDDLYWKFGGPTVPVEAIPPESHSTKYAVSHIKDPAKKVASLAESIGTFEKDLAKTVAYYLKLGELGIDAMEMAFHREQDRKQDAEGHWDMVARNVDRHRASCYRTIAMRKGQILAYRLLLAQLESEKLPLLYGRGKDLFDT